MALLGRDRLIPPRWNAASRRVQSASGRRAPPTAFPKHLIPANARRLTPFDLRQCLDDAFDLFSAKTADGTITLRSALDPTVPGRIKGDVTRLRQILVNLVGNAYLTKPYRAEDLAAG